MQRGFRRRPVVHAGSIILDDDDAAPYFAGIVRIGEFDGDPGVVARLPEGASVTIERAR